MDVCDELESMAAYAADDWGGGFEPSEDEIQRWQTLFAYSHFRGHRADQKVEESTVRVIECRMFIGAWLG